MHEIKLKQQLIWWPSLQDYNEAIQVPSSNLQDAELKNSLPYTNLIGLPRAVTGSFATVYRMHCIEKDFALRLFLRNIEDQAQRYELIADFIKHDNLQYAATFEFLENGIKVKNDWLPALKMEWIDGQSFDEYIIKNLNNSDKLGDLSDNFARMMQSLKQAGIAHGDLQHGNIIMCGDNIRLVDLDGMFVPTMQHLQATELGHSNYQHPGRAERHFGPYLDNFSAWVIYASIKGLQLDPRLLNQLGGGDDCLLFRQSDFLVPLQSAAFAAFEKHENNELQKLGRFIRAQLSNDLESIPSLQLPVPEIDVQQLIAIDESVSNIKSGPRLVRHEPADWLKKDNVTELLKSKLSSSTNHAKLITGQQSWIVPVKTIKQAEWYRPGASAFSTTAKANEELARLHDSLPYLPPELRVTTPRLVKFNRKLNKKPPVFYQFLMFFNPLVWLMLIFLFKGFTIDEDLRTQGFWYPATVTSVNRYETSKKEHFQHTDIELSFQSNNKTYIVSKGYGPDWGTYKVGDQYEIRALPSNPAVQEPFGEKIGFKQTYDLSLGGIFLLLNLVLEWFIWSRPLWHRRLARKGMPVIAEVGSLWRTTADKTKTVMGVTFSYRLGTQLYIQHLELKDMAQYKTLVKGNKEVLLCDPAFPKRIAVYRFCLYQSMLKTSGGKKHP